MYCQQPRKIQTTQRSMKSLVLAFVFGLSSVLFCNPSLLYATAVTGKLAMGTDGKMTVILSDDSMSASKYTGGSTEFARGSTEVSYHSLVWIAYQTDGRPAALYKTISFDGIRSVTVEPVCLGRTFVPQLGMRMELLREEFESIPQPISHCFARVLSNQKEDDGTSSITLQVGAGTLVGDRYQLLDSIHHFPVSWNHSWQATPFCVIRSLNAPFTQATCVLEEDVCAPTYDRDLYALYTTAPRPSFLKEPPKKLSSEDICPNLNEVQTKLPAGYLLDEKGNCCLDVCPNRPGLQKRFPQGYMLSRDNRRDCVRQHLDLSSLERVPFTPTRWGVQTNATKKPVQWPINGFHVHKEGSSWIIEDFQGFHPSQVPDLYRSIFVVHTVNSMTDDHPVAYVQLSSSPSNNFAITELCHLPEIQSASGMSLRVSPIPTKEATSLIWEVGNCLARVTKEFRSPNGFVNAVQLDIGSRKESSWRLGGTYRFMDSSIPDCIITQMIEPQILSTNDTHLSHRKVHCVFSRKEKRSLFNQYAVYVDGI